MYSAWPGNAIVGEIILSSSGLGVLGAQDRSERDETKNLEYSEDQNNFSLKL